MGTVVVASAGVAGMIAAPLVVKPLSRKYLTGQERSLNDLSNAEKDLVDACCALAIGLRQAAKGGGRVDAGKARALLEDALVALVDKSADLLWASQQWPLLQRRKFNTGFLSLGQSKGFAKELVKNKEPIIIGLGTVLILNLLSEGEHSFSEAEQDVLESIRRSTKALNEASNEEIADYVQAMSPEQLLGFKNNIKGIAHEIQFARLENNDGDMFEVELFEETNHPAADIRLINIETGEVRELQLKATSYGSYIEEHFERYPDVDLLATTEISEPMDIGTTGISNEQLIIDQDNVLRDLTGDHDVEITDSMTIAGLVALARNVKIILDSDPENKERRKALVTKSIKAGLVAGLAELLL